MVVEYLYMYILGFYDITIEGFSIEKFINECKINKIPLFKLKIEKSTILKCRILFKDLKNIEKISKNTLCILNIDEKNGLPILFKKYNGRKIFIISLILIFIFLFITTRFIWNIEISGNENMSNEEILSEIGNYGITIGKLKYKINTEEIENKIRLKNKNISWVGIKIKGTNVLVEVKETIEKPEIIDENKISNIIATENAVISKIIVRSGTSRVNIGDEVNAGDLLIEGIMEGKYTGIREVYSDGEIYGKKYYEKEKFETFSQEIFEETGEKSTIFEFYIKKFKIIFNKGVSKFEKYDTIRAYKKIKLFSDYYLPIEIIQITQNELKSYKKEYSKNELIEKIKNDLKNEIEGEIDEDGEYDCEYSYEFQNDGILVKANYSIEKMIGINE